MTRTIPWSQTFQGPVGAHPMTEPNHHLPPSSSPPSRASWPGGRVIIELFPDITPRAAENFRGLCTGEYGCGLTGQEPIGCCLLIIVD